MKYCETACFSETFFPVRVQKFHVLRETKQGISASLLGLLAWVLKAVPEAGIGREF